MLSPSPERAPSDNPGYRRVFRQDCLTLGVMLPIEAYRGDAPTLHDQVRLAQFAEEAGFASLGFRDVPLRDPSFGDLGQIHDPWVYMGYLAGQTREIALLTTSIVLPLRHPLHTAKAAASIDRLTGGRLLLGIASGDRPVEFPAFGVDAQTRGAAFREQVELLHRAWAESFPDLQGSYGHLSGADLVPKPVASHVPLLVTGQSQSDLSWIARHADGWLTYPRQLDAQANMVRRWRMEVEAASPGRFKPFAQSYYLDLAEQAAQPATPIHLGHRVGRHGLAAYLEMLRVVGVNHVILNLKYGQRPAAEVLQELAEFVLPSFGIR